MSKKIRLVVESICNVKGLSDEEVYLALQAALISATKKQYGADKEFDVVIDEDEGDYKTYQLWHVVDHENRDLEENPWNAEAELTLEQAKEIDEKLEIGDTIREEVESVTLSRIAAQTAKQVMKQRLRQLKREKTAIEFERRLGELVSGTVKKVTREFIVVEIAGNAEALLRRDQMLPKEIVRIGDRIRAVLKEVKTDQRGPQLFLSRSAPAMVTELFRIEVPEISEGSMELRGAARDPGSRAKVAVLAKDTRVDPIGACVGMRGTRVQAVSNELGGERVDIVLFDDNPAQFVINSIAPADVKSIVVDEDKHSMDVIVEPDQLSQAIGRGGQNVRLASELTGWTLNIMSEEDAQNRTKAESERLTRLFKEELGTTEELAATLVEEGFTDFEEIAYVDEDEFLAIEGIDEEISAQVREKAEQILLTQAITGKGVAPQDDLLSLDGMDSLLAEKLAKKGVCTQEELAELSVDDLLEIDGIDEERAKALILAARAPWFEDQSS